MAFHFDFAFKHVRGEYVIYIGDDDGLMPGAINRLEDMIKTRPSPIYCWECHGYEGMGDGPKSGELKDDWGDKILAFDFTTGTLKRGSSPENVYLTFATGLDGTGMPSYEDSLPEEDRWHLVSYTLKLMGLAK